VAAGTLIGAGAGVDRTGTGAEVLVAANFRELLDVEGAKTLRVALEVLTTPPTGRPETATPLLNVLAIYLPITLYLFVI